MNVLMIDELPSELWVSWDNVFICVYRKKQEVAKEIHGRSCQWWYEVSEGVSSLINTEGFLQSERIKRADMMNDQFESVYTQEDTDSIPDKDPSPHSPLELTESQNWCKT